MPDLSFELIKSIYKKYPKWSKAILFLILGVPLFFIVCYLLGDYGIVLIHTSLSIDGLLAYYGGFLAFIGTTVLGLVTITQTQKANEETEKANRRMIDLTEKQLFESKNTEKAFFVVKKVIIYGSNNSVSEGLGNYSVKINRAYNDVVFYITLKNIGQATAINISSTTAYISHKEPKIKTLGTLLNYDNIEKDKTLKINLKVSDILKLLLDNNERFANLNIDIGYENIYGIVYIQTLIIHVEIYKEEYHIHIVKYMRQVTLPGRQ